jgi:Rho termination factor, N-terminal domain
MAQNTAAARAKDTALYKRLRKLGVSSKESARVANTHARSFADWKVPELRRRAKRLGIKGRSSMNKKQLVKALRTN